ncbi:MAG: pyrroline-5-carboxylate reductase family protein, partial [Candidatus Omnitrophota bacterium]
LEKGIGGRPRVARVMPNMPALLGRGVSVACPGRYSRRQDLRYVVSIFQRLGKVLELKERHFDAVTALSGSGPAYVFYFLDALIKAGVSMGLGQGVARDLALETFLGSGELARRHKGALSGLIDRVASKGGTTEAALKVFARSGWDRLIFQAVSAAKRRSGELRGLLTR